MVNTKLRRKMPAFLIFSLQISGILLRCISLYIFIYVSSILSAAIPSCLLPSCQLTGCSSNSITCMTSTEVVAYGTYICILLLLLMMIFVQFYYMYILCNIQTRSTQPSVLPGSEMRTSFGWEGKSVVHTVCGQTRGCPGKTVRSLDNACYTPRFWVRFSRKGTISSVRTFTFTFAEYSLTFPHFRP